MIFMLHIVLLNRKRRAYTTCIRLANPGLRTGDMQFSALLVEQHGTYALSPNSTSRAREVENVRLRPLTRVRGYQAKAYHTR